METIASSTHPTEALANAHKLLAIEKQCKANNEISEWLARAQEEVSQLHGYYNEGLRRRAEAVQSNNAALVNHIDQLCRQLQLNEAILENHRQTEIAEAHRKSDDLSAQIINSKEPKERLKKLGKWAIGIVALFLALPFIFLTTISALPIRIAPPAPTPIVVPTRPVTQPDGSWGQEADTYYLQQIDSYLAILRIELDRQAQQTNWTAGHPWDKQARQELFQTFVTLSVIANNIQDTTPTARYYTYHTYLSQACDSLKQYSMTYTEAIGSGRQELADATMAAWRSFHAAMDKAEQERTRVESQ